MRAQSSGPLTTFLMFIPLVAVPLLAVVGIPDFSPANASPSDEGPDFQFRSADEIDGTVRRSADDLFAPISIHSDRQQAGMSHAHAPHPADMAAADPFRRIDYERQPAQQRQRVAHGRDVDARPNQPSEANATWGGLDFGDHENAPVRLHESTGHFRTVGGKPARGFVRSTNSEWDNPSRSPQPRAPSSDAGFGSGAQHTSSADQNRGFAETPPFSEEPLPTFFDGSPLLCERLMRSGQVVSPMTAQQPVADPSVPGERPEPKQRHPAAHEAMPSGEDDERPASSLTWRTAVAWLNQHGIDHYQLQPGHHGDEFHFSCAFTPSDNPRITHRFEAEAGEPLRAVEKVLAQIAAWQREHSRPHADGGEAESIDPQFGFGVE